MLNTTAASILERIQIARLERKFGKQIGKTANNGNMTFQKQVGNQTVTTGARYNGNIIAQVSENTGNIKGFGKKIRYNDDGDIVEVAHFRRATNFRKTVKENLDTGEVNIKTLRTNPNTEYIVEHTNIDIYGANTSKTTPVKIKGKSSPI